MESRLVPVFDALDAMHASRGWHWTPDTDPFEIAVGAILVQNTAWASVEYALANLRTADALHPVRLAALSDDELEALIRPSGQYRQKARKLRAFLELIEEAGSFEALLALPTDELRGRLLDTWGIGEETADVIVLYCARQPAFVIDAYTKRIFSRLGLGPGESATYAAWQRFFTAALPEDVAAWGRFHALIVLHAKHTCRKHTPRCGDCSLASVCRFVTPEAVATLPRYRAAP